MIQLNYVLHFLHQQPLFKLQFHRHTISSIFAEKWTTLGVNFCTRNWCPNQRQKQKNKRRVFQKKNTRQKLIKKRENKNTNNDTKNTEKPKRQKDKRTKVKECFLLSWPVTGIPGVPSPVPEPHIGFFRACSRIHRVTSNLPSSVQKSWWKGWNHT